jgi:hypothetical protein
MIIKIKPLSSNLEVLSGSMRGRQLLRKLLDRAIEPHDPEPVFLDFVGVTTATASFLRDGPLAFRAILRGQASKLYPVFANASEPILEDLEFILRQSNDATLCCRLSTAGKPSNVQLIGRLDEKQRLAFDLIKHLGEADAGELQRHHSEDRVGTTAWNNRLSALVSKGLIMPFPRGRAKTYRISVGE